MKSIIVNKVLLLFLSTAIIFTDIYAAKVKSSESSLTQLDVKVQSLIEHFDSLKYVLKGNGNSKSFVSTDFWGLKPSWYVEGAGANKITMNYPFTDSWINKYGIWRQYSSHLVRNINGVILTPILSRNIKNNRNSPKSWTESLNLEFNFSPGYRNSDYYKSYVKSYLTSNGVPASQIENALAEFESKLSATVHVITDKVFSKFDNLYVGIAKSGYLQVYTNIAEKEQVDIDYYTTPNKHEKIFTEEVFVKYNTNLNVKSRKDLNAGFNRWAKEASLFEYYKGSYNLKIDVPIQYFIVAHGMNKSQKFNQLSKLKDMLNKKTESGKVKKSEKGEYTVYEDSFDKYTRGRIAINFKTGVGYWQLPMWDDHGVIQSYIKKIQEDTKTINIVIKKIFALSLDEVVKKFKNNNSQTNDF